MIAIMNILISVLIFGCILSQAAVAERPCANPTSALPGQAQALGCGVADQVVPVTGYRDSRELREIDIERAQDTLKSPSNPSARDGPGASNPSATNKAAASPTNTSEPKCGATTTKPVIIATGEKILPQSDFAALGSYGFSLSREYRSQSTTGKAFGSSWPSSLDGVSIVYTLTGCRWIDVLCYPRQAIVRSSNGAR